MRTQSPPTGRIIKSASISIADACTGAPSIAFIAPGGHRGFWPGDAVQSAAGECRDNSRAITKSPPMADNANANVTMLLRESCITSMGLSTVIMCAFRVRFNSLTKLAKAFNVSVEELWKRAS